MNQAIKHFYKYQPTGPNYDLISFEEIPTVENPSRLIQIAHYDIELTACFGEKELQLNLKERGNWKYNDLRIPTNDPVQALHEMECFLHIMSLGLGPVPVQLLGWKRRKWTKRNVFPYCHSHHVQDPFVLPRFTLNDEVHYLQQRKYEDRGIYDGAMLSIADESTRNREGLFDGIFQ